MAGMFQDRFGRIIRVTTEKGMEKMKVWYDREGDFLEVTFRQAKGYMRDLGDDIFERVDEQGKVIGFAIFNFSKRDQKPVEIPLELSS